MKTVTSTYKELDDIQKDRESLFLSDLQSIVTTTRHKGYEAVNHVIVICNWLIGRRIVEQEQQGKERAEYGKYIIKQASEFLTTEFGKGFSITNLKNFRSFYLTFNNLFAKPMNSPVVFMEQEKINWSDISDHFTAAQKGQTRLTNLSWSHYECLLRVKDADARDWYLREAESENWSVRTLDRNISSQYYYRLLHTPEDNRQEVIAEMRQKTSDFQKDKLEIMKNPIVAEFLGLSHNPTYSETKLETAILEHLKDFIMELGRGFAFVARQKHIKTDAGDFYIDLVFYNYILKCFLLIDLKTSRITHQDIGQMDMYIRMFDELECTEGDNPTIGLLLCAETSKDLARYSILRDSNQLFAAKYMTYLPKKEELLAEIEHQKYIFELQQGKRHDK